MRSIIRGQIIRRWKGGNEMRSIGFAKGLWIATLLIVLFGGPVEILAEEKIQEWELINPEGVVKVVPLKLNLHPPRLEGKTILLRSNGKHNSDKFLIRVGELLKEKSKGLKIIYSWEVAPETVDPITGSRERSKKFAEKLASFKPDLVIASQAD
jgi:hypothetical protein